MTHLLTKRVITYLVLQQIIVDVNALLRFTLNELLARKTKVYLYNDVDVCAIVTVLSAVQLKPSSCMDLGVE